MKRLAGLSTLALIISGTSGCGWLWGEDGYFRDRGSDYLQAQQVPPMQVPGDVELRPIAPLLPWANSASSAATPPSIATSSTANESYIEVAWFTAASSSAPGVE